MSDNNGKENKDFEGLGKLLDHNYDNIRELDNPLPGWWLVTFWGTIVFAVIYFAYYQLMGGPTSDQMLKSDMAEIGAQVEAGRAAQPQKPEVNLLELYANADAKTKGQQVFIMRCVACHGSKGEGIIGPNLTDDFWINGDGTLAAIRDNVKKGVLEKGMPAWEATLPAEEVDAVSVYVKSLYGSNPPNSKAAQGDKKENKL